MAVELNGTNQYLNAATGLGVTNFPISISCLVYLDQLPNDAGDEMAIVHLNQDNGGYDWITLRADDTNGDQDVQANARGETTAVSESDVEVTANTWQHYGGTYENQSYYAYLNGTQGPQSTTNQGVMSNWTNLYIGAINVNGLTDYVDGAIAELGIWNVILTPAEMLILSKGYSPLFVRPANLVHYFPLIKDSKDIVNGISMTANNGPTWRAHPPIIHPSGLWIPVGAQGAPPTGNAGIMTTNTGFWGATF